MPNAAILATLEADRLATAAHLAHIDVAIAAIRALDGEAAPSRRLGGRPPKAVKLSKSAARRAVQSVAVLRALKAGPLPVGELVKHAGVSRYVLSVLVKKGVITASGHTSGRRYARPKKSS